MSKPLEGKTALVSGASSGFGEATALALAAAGANVSLSARRADRLEVLKSRITAQGGSAHVVVADFSKEADAARAVTQTEAAYGQLDILINNAGVMYLEPVVDADLGRWRHMFELNVLGLMAATQAALKGMQARRDGHVVNIASTAGRTANPNGGGYSGTKFAVVAFSESLRKEVYKDNIRVTVIEPGVAETELRDHVAHEQARNAVNAWAQSIRQLQSTDIANAVLYAVCQPDRVCINEILMRSTDQDR